MNENTAGDNGGEAFHCCGIDCYAGMKCTEIICSIILYICFYHYVIVGTASHSIDDTCEICL
jgi:hypothetical protein